MLKLLFASVLCVIMIPLKAQHLGQWVLGDKITMNFEQEGINFGTSGHSLSKSLDQNSGLGTINVFDSAGTLLFYYDGIHLRDRNHDTVPGGGNFFKATRNIERHCADILPSKNEGIYYLIHWQNITSSYFFVYYSVIESNAISTSVLSQNNFLKLIVSFGPPSLAAHTASGSSYLVSLRDSSDGETYLKRLELQEDTVNSILSAETLSDQQLKHAEHRFELNPRGNPGIISFNRDNTQALVSQFKNPPNQMTTYAEYVLYELGPNLEFLSHETIDTGFVIDLRLGPEYHHLSKSIFSSNKKYIYYVTKTFSSPNQPRFYVCKYSRGNKEKEILFTAELPALEGDIYSAMDMKYGFDGNIYIAHTESKNGIIKLSRIVNPDSGGDSTKFEWQAVSLPSTDNKLTFYFHLPICNFVPSFPKFSLSRQNPCSDTLLIHNYSSASFSEYQLFINGTDTLIFGNPAQIKIRVQDTGMIKFAAKGYRKAGMPAWYLDSIYFEGNKSLNMADLPEALAYVQYSQGEISVNWNSVGNANEYELYRSDIPAGKGDLLYSGKDSSYIYTPKEDSRKEPYYLLKVTDTCGTGHASNVATMMEVNITAQGEDRAQLIWNKYLQWTKGVEEYRLYKLSADGSPVLLYWGNDTFFTDINFDTGYADKACYRVHATHTNGLWYSSGFDKCFSFPKRVWIPNAFTPKQDGLNDEFRPYVYGIIEGSYHLSIYNRWGQLIFESTDREKGWDGTYQGSALPAGLYYYVLKCKTSSYPDDGIKLYKGAVNLIR